MRRRTFGKFFTASLLAAPSLISAQRPQHVTIIGAGVAGLTAAHHLTNSGLQVQILEASNNWGGRVKRLSGFADVPLDLGAEWIHEDPDVLGLILGQGETSLGVKTIDYRPQTYQFWNNGTLKNFDLLRLGYQEVKFYDTTWYGFFESFMVPALLNSITFRAAVSHVSKQGRQLSVGLTDGRILETDKVLVTVPLSVLQNDEITFSDGLSLPEKDALKDIDFGSGFKAFLKFSERFYPDMLFEGSRVGAFADTWAEKLYYDAAFGKPTRQNILGLFTVSDEPLRRTSLDNAALITDILSELTEIFGSVVMESFVDGVVQNWSREPRIMGSYSMENHSNHEIVDILAPIEGRVFFAGEVLGGANQSTVHGAAFSAIRAANQIITA